MSGCRGYEQPEEAACACRPHSPELEHAAAIAAAESAGINATRTGSTQHTDKRLDGRDAAAAAAAGSAAPVEAAAPIDGSCCCASRLRFRCSRLLSRSYCFSPSGSFCFFPCARDLESPAPAAPPAAAPPAPPAAPSSGANMRSSGAVIVAAVSEWRGGEDTRAEGGPEAGSQAQAGQHSTRLPSVRDVDASLASLLTLLRCCSPRHTRCVLPRTLPRTAADTAADIEPRFHFPH